MGARCLLSPARIGRKGAPGTLLGTGGMVGGVVGAATARAGRAGEPGGDIWGAGIGVVVSGLMRKE